MIADTEANREHNVVAGLLVRGKKVLLCRRSLTRAWYPGVWDLPGGHREAGETAADALVRELQEELGIRVSDLPGEPLEHVETDEFTMQVWLITDWRGTPTNLAPHEHAELAWFSPERTSDLRLASDIYPPLISKVLSVHPTQP